MNLIQTLEAEAIEQLTKDRPIPEFRPGDTLRVGVKVVEGERARSSRSAWATMSYRAGKWRQWRFSTLAFGCFPG